MSSSAHMIARALPRAELCSDDAQPLVALLQELGAGRLRHSRRTLLEHLVGTAAILERWGCAARVWKAGLFHSVYGTADFTRCLLSFDERPRIARAIGADAEHLAFVFCAFERNSLLRAVELGEPYEVTLLDGRALAVSRADVCDLLAMVWANALDQYPHARRTPEVAARSRRALARVWGFLSEPARRELEVVYGR